MKNKKLIFSVLFTGILLLNTFLFTDINENRLQLNSLFTLATAQTENVENGEFIGTGTCGTKVEHWYDSGTCPWDVYSFTGASDYSKEEGNQDHYEDGIICFMDKCDGTRYEVNTVKWFWCK